jgi:hypothetical protein
MTCCVVIVAAPCPNHSKDAAPKKCTDRLGFAVRNLTRGELLKLLRDVDRDELVRIEA